MQDPITLDLTEHAVLTSFSATLDALRGAIARAGLLLFATIDHAGGARALGLSMPSTTVLIYGHPKGGTPVMPERPTAALDLPLRVLIRELGDGRVAVALHPVAAVLAHAGVSVALQNSLDPAQRILLEALS